MKLGQWLGLIAIAVSLYIIWQTQQLLLLVFTAIVLATAINGFVRWLRRCRLKRSAAVTLAIATLLVLGIAVILLIAPQFVQQFGELVTLLPVGLSALERSIDWFENSVADYIPNLPDADWLINRLQTIVANLSRQVSDFLINSVNAIFEFVIVLVLTLMLLINPQSYRQVFVRFFPAFYRNRVDEVLTI